jgi:HAMP domain-containing protein
MPDSSPATAGSIPGAQTIDLNEYPAYGTAPDDYRLWFDYVYEWFGATRARWLRRYLVSAGIGVGVFLLGLLIIGISSFIGLLLNSSASLTPARVLEPFSFYLKEPTAYIFSLDMAYAFHVLRWLSQTYHVRTNRLRACFTISDEEYKKLVQPLARYASNPKRLRLAIAVMAVACAYFLFYTFSPPSIRNLFGLIYPHAVPLTWRGAYGIPTLFVVLFFACLIVLVCFTAFHLTNTLIYLSRTLQRDAAEDSQHVQPLPSLIEDRFDGILDLSLTGVLQFVGGIVLLEFLYRAQLDLAGIIFVSAAIVQGGLLFFAPRVAARRIVGIARDRLFLQFISKKGAERQPMGADGELLNLATLSWDDLSDRSEVMRAEIASRSATITFVGILGLLASWALSVVLPIINAFNLDRQVLQAAGQLLQRLLPLP